MSLRRETTMFRRSVSILRTRHSIFVPKIGTAVIAAWGWRAVFPSLAALTLLIALPLGILWFREPTPEQRPRGITDAAGNLIGVTMAQALRSRYFWVMVVSTILISSAYGGAHVHMVQMVQKHGFSAMQAAGVATIVGLGILMGRVIIGLLFDRFWAPAIAFPVLVMPAMSCYLLMGTGGDLNMLKLAGFLLGFAAGAESDVIAFLTARYFGMAHYGKIYGAIYLFFGLCSGISPKIYGRVVDTSGSYDPILQVAMVAFVLGGVKRRHERIAGVRGGGESRLAGRVHPGHRHEHLPPRRKRGSNGLAQHCANARVPKNHSR